MDASLLSEAIAQLVRWSGLAWIVRNTVARHRVSILLYHDPDPQVLEGHLAYLAKRYHFIDMDRLVTCLESRAWDDLPSRSLVITLDDGRKRQFELTETFRQHGVVPTMYVCTQVVGTNRHFWFMDVSRAAAPRELPRAELLTRVEALGFEQDREYPDAERQALSRQELAAMCDGVDFQSHTRYHPMLTTCGTEECMEEIAGSRTDIAEITGTAARHLAYPNGDYSIREIRAARDAGYRSARTIDLGWVGPDTDPFRLPIIGLSRDNASIARLAADLSGITSYIACLRKGRPLGRRRPAVVHGEDVAP